VAVRGEAEGGLARVVLTQVFANPHPEPLKVSYLFPLPAGAAVAGYLVRVGDRTLRGEIDRREAARERFEQALLEGRTAGIVDQERSSLFAQELGNVPPGVEVSVELILDQRLAWLSGGMWEWRFPTVVAPRYLGFEGRVPGAGAVTVDVAGAPAGVRASLESVVLDAVTGSGRPESPSHSVLVREKGRGAGAAKAAAVTLAGEGASLDRDLVLRWAVARPRPGVSLRRARPPAGAPHGGHAYGLLTLVPPAVPEETLPRDLVVLLDTSGSMAGRPLDQARRVVGALVDGLGDADTLDLIAFSSRPERWRRGAVRATEEMRREARRWLESLKAGGATEMVEAVREALRPLRAGAQREVALVTDGLIGFESEMVRSVRDGLPAGSRLHMVGVGPAVNRSLTQAGARAGRGAEILVGLDEDVSGAASRILAATGRPVVVDVQVEGAAVAGRAPRQAPDLMAGAPVLLGVRLAAGGGDLVVRGRTARGTWEERLSVPPTEPGEGSPAVTALFGREAVEDLEMDLAAGGDQEEIDRAVERIGLEFGLATRRTSWVAGGEEPAVDPRRPVRVTRIPQELAYGLSAEGLGLRAATGGVIDVMHRATSLADFHMALPPTAARMTMQPPPSGRFLERASIGDARPGPPEPFVLGAGTPGPAPRTFRGRWVAAGTRPAAREGGRPPEPTAVLEFEVEGERLRWDPEARAVIESPDGTRREVELVRDASTHAGDVESGCLVRLVLTGGPAEARGAVAVEIVTGGETIRIVPRS
jgi:Ca-activated chloride channel family protein